MLFLVDRHSSLLVGICMECIKERYMPVLLSSISLFGKALFYTQFGMASRIGRFLIANSVCENLEGEIKNSTRAKLVETIATVPIIVSGKEKSEIGLAQHVLRPRGNTKTRTTRSR